MRHVKTKFDDMDQHSQSSTLEIDGIPEEKGENVLSIVIEVGQGLGIPITENMISMCHRLRQPPHQTGPRGITVQFTRRFDKEKGVESEED